MSTAALFAVGVAVTLLVAAALALLIYAAIQDGRTNASVAELEARRSASERRSPSAA